MNEPKKSKAFDLIMAGLADAIAYAKGDKTRGREVKPKNKPD